MKIKQGKVHLIYSNRSVMYMSKKENEYTTLIDHARSYTREEAIDVALLNASRTTHNSLVVMRLGPDRVTVPIFETIPGDQIKTGRKTNYGW